MRMPFYTRLRFGIIDRHIAAQILRFWTVAAVVTAATVWLFAFTENRRRGLPTGEAAASAGLYAPNILLSTLPLTIGGGAVLAAFALRRSGALTAAEAFGRAPGRTALSFGLASCLIGAGTVTLLSPIAARCSRALAVNELQTGDLSGMLRAGGAVYRRFTAPVGGYYVTADDYRAGTFIHARVLQFAADDTLLQRLNVPELRLEADALRTLGPVDVTVPDSPLPTHLHDVVLPIIDTLRDPAALRPNMLSIFQLGAFIDDAETRGESARAYRLQRSVLWATPLTTGIAGAAAAVAVPRRRRSPQIMRAALYILFGAASGYVLIIAGETAVNAGLLSRSAAVWGVRAVLAACVSAFVLRHNEGFA